MSISESLSLSIIRRISLSGVLGFDSLNLGSLFTSGGFQSAAVGGLRWRLFDFGRVNAEVEQARGANAEALVDYRQAVLKAAAALKFRPRCNH